jgi:hypothetical protein
MPTGIQEDNPSTPFHFRSWDDICKYKENRGLCIRDLLTVNRSLILHATWNIATEKDTYLTAILKAKYFLNTSFWLSTSSTTKSIFWATILQIKEALNHYCSVQVHSLVFPLGLHP